MQSSMQLKDLFPLLKDTFTSFGETKCARLAAALSYYTIFSIAPILIVVISIAALFFNASSARTEIVAQIGNIVGSTGADAIGEILTNANKGGQGGNIIATVVGFVTILVGATGLFAALQDSLNTIWGVEPKPDAGIFVMVKARVLSFVMVLGIGFLLIVSLVASVAVKAASDWLGRPFGRRRMDCTDFERDFVLYFAHPIFRADVQDFARRANPMARRLDRRGFDEHFILHRQIRIELVSRAPRHRVGLRQRGRSRRFVIMD